MYEIYLKKLLYLNNCYGIGMIKLYITYKVMV